MFSLFAIHHLDDRAFITETSNKLGPVECDSGLCLDRIWMFSVLASPEERGFHPRC
jgi:hypothetical protein